MAQKLFFFDIDNTLVAWPKGFVSKKTKYAIEELQRAGHHTAIATGRLQKNAIEYASLAGIKDFVADGGNSVTVDGNILYMYPLPIETVKFVLRQLEAKGIPWAAATKNVLERYTTHEHLTTRMSPWDPYTTVYDPNFDFEQENTFYKTFIYITPEECEYKNIDYGTLETLRYGDAIALIEPMDKSIGIRYLADYYKIPYDQIVTFGDGNNDILMFKPEWLNIAMGNAREGLKAKADYITRDCDDDGIYHALLHFGFIEPMAEDAIAEA